MKYIRLRAWLLFLVLIGGFILLIRSSIDRTGPYKSSSPVTNEQITTSYPALYKAVAQRDAGQLDSFLSHSYPEVRQQAWRALASTPVDSVSSYIDLAIEQNSEDAWFAISQHTLSEEQLRLLEERFEATPPARPGIARVLGRQGDEQSLEFLLNQLNQLEANDSPEDEQALALATSRLLTRHPVTANDQVAIIRQAFEAGDDQVTRAYLYGWYRGSRQPLSSVAEDTLYSRWQSFGAGTDAGIDQYVNRLLKDRTTYTMAVYYNGEQELEDQVPLSYELAQSLEELSLNDRNALAAKFLLTHPNPHVQQRTLQSIRGKVSEGDNLYRYITQTMLAEPGLEDIVWLEALETAVLAGPAMEESYRERLERIPEDNLYLLPQVLSFYSNQEAPEEFLQRVEHFISREDPQYAMYALEALNSYWQSLEEGQKTSSQRESIRELTFQALARGDRGVASAAQRLLQQNDLFQQEDFSKINQTLTAFTLPEDLEVFQAYGALYHERFEEQARPVIDSLAAQEYMPLNKSLAESGWNVSVDGAANSSFLQPNWERLWELGRDPVWTLQTEKGIIRMRLKPLIAPATVSLIDSLSRAGAYDEVPFHRVVPNFVIQGGDIERGDGFGSPGFTLPTEVSPQSFSRGAVGVASAGRDTESSQYFIMHQWKPHLNGNYTLFGEVTEGQDVVDRILPGDRVLSAGW